MSYDLYFCTERHHQISKAELERYFSSIPNFDGNWKYENSQTGVYCFFDYISSDDDYDLIIPEGYIDANLSFNLNYLRPKFFAYEIMPIVEKMCVTLQLLVIDPQSSIEGGDNSPKIAKANELIESWSVGNRLSLNINKQQGSAPPYLNDKIAYSWWKYQLNLSSLKEMLGESVYGPKILLFVDNQYNSVRTAITWTEAIPFVFPPCDIVIIVRKKKTKGFFHRKVETTIGWIEASEVRKMLENHLTRFETEIGDIDILQPEQAKLAESIFFGMSLQMLDGFTRIAPDGFVDEKLS